MFDFVRNHTRLVLGFLLLLIVPSFVFFGVQGYTRFTESANETVAKVDGVAITRAEWDAAHARNVERVRRESPGIDPQLLDSPQARRDTLEGMVRDRVLLTAANKLQLHPSVGRMAMLFDSNPQLAGLRGADGKINRDLLAAQGMTPEMFDQRLRQDFAMQQVLAGITQSPVVPAATAAAAIDPLLQRREVQLQRFDPASYRAGVVPTEAEIEAYYKANETLFLAPEQAQIEYVVLDLEPLAKAIAVPEEDLRAYYAENASRYTVAEERRASHILVNAPKEMPAAERAQARERAESLLAEVRKNPASFAEVARKNSQDPGSAERGGDLDFFSRGAMVKPFEDAVFAMKRGEISNVVESDFGFHVIMLTDQRGGEKKSFEAVRPEIEAEVRKSLAQRRWSEVAEQFTNTVYEQADSLQPVVDNLKLEKRTATVQRTPAPGATGALGSARLLQAVFASDSLVNKRNTDAVEIGPNQLAAARVVSHQPARTLPLADVRDAVRARLVAEQATALARKEGEARLAALRQAPGESLGSTVTISRVQRQGLPPPVIDAALRADAGKLPAVEGVDLGAQGYVVLRVTQVLPRDPVPGGDDALRQQYGQAWAAAEADAYLGALKKRYKVDVKAVAATTADAASAPAR
jgi:peptidyl-prolyl cis-trans isomerase D